jgi:hypothetical protein
MQRSHVVIVMSLCLLGVGGSLDPHGGECPQGFNADEPRATAVLDRLRDSNSSLTTSVVPSQMCFGATNVSVVTEDGLMLLDARADERASAARVAHLASHISNRSRFFPAKRPSDCAAWVDDVLHAEAEAFVIELDVAHDLNVKTPYAFEEDAARARTKSARVELIAAFLRTHRDGDTGIEPLARGYEDRCRGVD